jgi:hypothetical protein
MLGSKLAVDPEGNLREPQRTHRQTKRKILWRVGQFSLEDGQETFPGKIGFHGMTYLIGWNPCGVNIVP